MYEGLNYSTKTMVESMCGGEFNNKSVREAWDFLGDVAEKLMLWVGKFFPKEIATN